MASPGSPSQTRKAVGTPISCARAHEGLCRELPFVANLVDARPIAPARHLERPGSMTLTAISRAPRPAASRNASVSAGVEVAERSVASRTESNGARPRCTLRAGRGSGMRGAGTSVASMRGMMVAAVGAPSQ